MSTSRPQEPARVGRREREALNGHPGSLVYLTGLSGAGKSTIAYTLERVLHARGVRACVVDGDELRVGLSRGLGFSPEDRKENMRRAREVAWMMAEAGLVVVASLISPFRADRGAARDRLGPGRFIEVFVDAPLSVCEARDPKGLYRRARSGELRGLTGIDSPYEAPLDPDVRIDTTRLGPEEGAAAVIECLQARSMLPPWPTP
jgi:adenylyl-sulfate kinase